MNLSQFLNQVDTVVSDMSKEELQKLIHTFASNTPETQRENFLLKLRTSNLKADSKTTLEAEQQKISDIRAEINLLKQKLSMINDGELYIIGKLNEEYDDWYNDDDEQFCFEDPTGIINTIEACCTMVHQCLDVELYQDGYELATCLLTVEVTAEGEYSEYSCDALDLRNLQREGILPYNMRRLVLDTMHLAYQVLSADERAESLYQFFRNSECGNITLENMIQDAPIDLNYQEEFLDEWICFLGKCKGRGAERLVEEAVMLLNNFDQALEYARRFYTYHPGMYTQLLLQLKEEKDRDELLISVGEEAIQKLEIQYLVRSDIALLTADACLRMGKQHEAESCRLEAFRSKTDLTNYLRLICECSENTGYADEAKNIYATMHERQDEGVDQSIPFGEPKENGLGRWDYYEFAFFDKEFQKVINEAMNVKEAIGWSSTFMKTGMALFLLLLYKDKELPSGCRRMCAYIVCHTGFSSEEYAKGLNCTFDMDEEALLWCLFNKWKERVTLTEEERLAIVAKLSDWIDMRVEGIMQNNHRHYYGECAAFVAALGEVLESQGENDGKNQLLKLYKDRYPRRTSFHSELRGFGMRK